MSPRVHRLGSLWLLFLIAQSGLLVFSVESVPNTPLSIQSSFAISPGFIQQTNGSFSGGTRSSLGMPRTVSEGHMLVVAIGSSVAPTGVNDTLGTPSSSM